MLVHHPAEFAICGCKGEKKASQDELILGNRQRRGSRLEPGETTSVLGSRQEAFAHHPPIPEWKQKPGFVAAFYCKLLVLPYRFWTVVTGADIPLTSQIGGGLLIPHPNGIVIHPDARIGVNCLIFQQVTLGSRSGPGVPEIGGHVDIGAGAKILEPVKIGAHARIGANAVILTSVDGGATAVGST